LSNVDSALQDRLVQRLGAWQLVPAQGSNQILRWAWLIPHQACRSDAVLADTWATVQARPTRSHHSAQSFGILVILKVFDRLHMLIVERQQRFLLPEIKLALSRQLLLLSIFLEDQFLLVVNNTFERRVLRFLLLSQLHLRFFSEPFVLTVH
jgi:hypothetical protein